MTSNRIALSYGNWPFVMSQRGPPTSLTPFLQLGVASARRLAFFTPFQTFAGGGNTEPNQWALVLQICRMFGVVN